MAKKLKICGSLFGILLSFCTEAIEVPLSPYSTNRIIVKLKKGEILDPHFLHLKKAQHLFARTYVLYTDNLALLEKELRSEDIFEYVEYDYVKENNKLESPGEKIKLEFSQKNLNAAGFNDPGLNKQWTFLDESQFGISVLKAYATSRNEPQQNEIIVAVVDTGVDFTHQDLKDVMWVNDKEIPENGLDDDNNGYIDDIHGINTLIRDSEGRATNDVKDGHSHGTHVSGIIAAKQNNGLGIAGVSSHAKIMAIRTVPNESDELDVDVIEAYLYAAKNGAKIINCSFGKARNEGGQTVREAIAHIGSNYGVLVVAAAGNDTSNIDTRLTYPASYDNDNLLVIASTSKRGGLSFFSNYGHKNVDLASPGSDIFSTVPGNSYANMSGTSMASPNAAGVAAEVLSYYPNMGPVELKNKLMNTISPVSAFNKKMVSPGRIDLARALINAQ